MMINHAGSLSTLHEHKKENNSYSTFEEQSKSLHATCLFCIHVEAQSPRVTSLTGQSSDTILLVRGDHWVFYYNTPIDIAINKSFQCYSHKYTLTDLTNSGGWSICLPLSELLQKHTIWNNSRV